ncbi:hypothetical protein A9Q80_05310 [Cycloclasticus sp. 46_83_sub15_T18]|nr:hypothetical protein A9Q80_05310 [Cycloclasticus sp. 46_83_sub15_T18]
MVALLCCTKVSVSFNVLLLEKEFKAITDNAIKHSPVSPAKIQSFSLMDILLIIITCLLG